MNILIASIYSYNSYSRGIMPDVLQTQLDKHPDAKIYYLTNSGSFDISYFNLEKNPGITYLDKVGAANTLNLINGDFTHLKISDIVRKEDVEVAQSFLQKRKVNFDLSFENFEIGAATLSTYISQTRDRELLNADKPFVKELALNALVLFLALKRFLNENNIELVYNFNGRHGYVRAVMRAAMALNLDCYNIERTRLGGYIDFYKNQFPHDPYAKFQFVEKYWKESSLPENEKKQIGEQFFNRQRTGESVVFPSYTGKMEKGKLPAAFLEKKNIVLYNSSDDEVAAFGDSFKYPLFEDQNQGLEFLVDLVGNRLPSRNLIIRMHPNLEKVHFDYVERIRELHQKYPNIFVVFPESPVDSYSLLEVAEKVISFGSTMGLEANFQRKPVILLGKGFFYFADYAYKPESKEEIFSLLEAELTAKPIIDTLKVGFYFQKGGVKTKYYYEEKLGEGVFFKGKRIHFYTVAQRLRAKFIKLVYRFQKRS